jgi:putative salt-induced outer membrane protein
MKRLLCGLLGLLTCLFGTAAVAQEAGSQRWKNETEVALVNTTGNSEVLTIAFANELEYNFTPALTGNWKLGALQGKTSGETTAERYYTDLRFDYRLAERVYTFLLGGWLKDRFAGIDRRVNFGPGIGYHVIKGPKSFLRCEAGLNYTYEDYVVQESADFLEGRAYSRYEYMFSEKNRFLLSVEYLQDLNASDNYKLNSETAVVAGLIGALSLKIGYEVRYQNRPKPATLKKTDTVLNAAFVITY